MSNVIKVDFKKKCKVKSDDEMIKDIMDTTGALVVFPEVTVEQMKEHFAYLLEQGIAQVILEPAMPGVIVPDHLKQIRGLPLNFSYKFRIPDFKFNDYGIEGSLSFNKTPFFCKIPWSAVAVIRPAILR